MSAPVSDLWRLGARCARAAVGLTWLNGFSNGAAMSCATISAALLAQPDTVLIFGTGLRRGGGGGGGGGEMWVEFGERTEGRINS